MGTRSNDRIKATDRRVDLDGLRFRYREAGAPTSPPLVLLHQLGSDARDWDAVAAALADRFHVLALDLRGHGESARAQPYTFERMRDDVALFVDALKLERFALLGHSMGGTVAFLVAEAFPDRLRALVVEDTPPPTGSNLPEPPPEPPSPVAFDWGVVRTIVRQLNQPDPNWWDRLKDIRARTLIIGGGATSPIPQQRLADVAALIPNARFVTIEGAGHRVHATKADAFIPLVREFLLSCVDR
ncbi:MAG TPA: alpha/beta fold hydrolase [Pseudomonadales bacterium]|nr:alpha/beta fold hydrolase [Pseudomonadales bacterium]